MKGTSARAILLLFFSVANTKEHVLSDLPEEVLEHFKNFALLNSLNIDKNSIEIVPAASGQTYKSQTVTTTMRPPPSDISSLIEGSTLPPNKPDVSSSSPFVEEVTIHPPLHSHTGTPVPERILQEQNPGFNQLAVPAPATLVRTIPEPVYVRVLQPIHIPVPQPYPIYFRVPVELQSSLGVSAGSTGGLFPDYSIYRMATGQISGGLLDSYVASRLGGVNGNSLNPYQSVYYQKTWR